MKFCIQNKFFLCNLMKVTIITTEASGDFLGAALYKELKKRKVYINGIGGKLLTNEV